MLEAADVVEYTGAKQDLQLVTEQLLAERMADFDLKAFLVDPRGYTRAFLASAASSAIKAVAPDAYKLGQVIAAKVRG